VHLLIGEFAPQQSLGTAGADSTCAANSLYERLGSGFAKNLRHAARVQFWQFSIEVARNVPLKFIRREKFFRETSCATMKAERLQGVADVASTGKGQ
jgi:hypothetical protein